jgi:hypothetical protein
VLIEVRSAGVGNWEEFVRVGEWDVGREPPMALGVEAAGVIAAVGDAVEDYTPGDEVMTHPLPLRDQGTWAPRLLPTTRACRRPGGMAADHGHAQPAQASPKRPRGRLRNPSGGPGSPAPNHPRALRKSTPPTAAAQTYATASPGSRSASPTERVGLSTQGASHASRRVRSQPRLALKREKRRRGANARERRASPRGSRVPAPRSGTGTASRSGGQRPVRGLGVRATYRPARWEEPAFDRPLAHAQANGHLAVAVARHLQRQDDALARRQGRDHPQRVVVSSRERCARAALGSPCSGARGARRRSYRARRIASRRATTRSQP